MEATLFEIPAIALSQNMSEGDFRERDGGMLRENTRRPFPCRPSYPEGDAGLLPKDVLMNVNFPAASRMPIAGIEVTREGRSKLGDEIIENKDPRGHSYYWIGARQAALNYPKGTDLHAVKTGLFL